eukprot:scaffold179_cov71-Skeletonema_dohrnii-CCMP3373.AAC.2
MDMLVHSGGKSIDLSSAISDNKSHVRNPPPLALALHSNAIRRIWLKPAFLKLKDSLIGVMLAIIQEGSRSGWSWYSRDPGEEMNTNRVKSTGLIKSQALKAVTTQLT